ncbi:Mitochondrial Import Receptor Subunit Tom70 [Manis pentadactyla]|nr:Mitochondrial Import Receptor Subunit Tom70 [Manis pentadactyla]
MKTLIEAAEWMEEEVKPLVDRRLGNHLWKQEELPRESRGGPNFGGSSWDRTCATPAGSAGPVMLLNDFTCQAGEKGGWPGTVSAAVSRATEPGAEAAS